MNPMNVIGERCYKSHPPLKIISKLDGKEYKIYGGSCSEPVVDDADIYIGFDRNTMNYTMPWPWEPTPPYLEVMYPITDMKPPSNAESFKKMVTWVCNQLHAGKKIHAGCIGGHGRTGLFLAAVAKEFSGIEDAITYVRTNYCNKVVETGAQVDFLVKNYGVKKTHVTKEFSGVGFGASNAGTYYDSYSKGNYSPDTGIYAGGSGGVSKKSAKVVQPVSSKRCLFGTS